MATKNRGLNSSYLLVSRESEERRERERRERQRARIDRRATGNPFSVIVPQYGSSKITVFVWGKNTILNFLGNTK